MSTHISSHQPVELVQINLSLSSEDQSLFTYYNGRKVRLIQKGTSKIPALKTAVKHLSHDGEILARMRLLSHR